jgi:hypothetical protein
VGCRLSLAEDNDGEWNNDASRLILWGVGVGDALMVAFLSRLALWGPLLYDLDRQTVSEYGRRIVRDLSSAAESILAAINYPSKSLEAPGMKKHEWREKTDAGETRLVTVTRHAGKWQLRSRLKSEDEWTKFEKIELADLEELHDVIARKYQRNRVPHEHVLEVEAMIAEAKRRG